MSANLDWTPLLWFGAVIALIPLALWLLKRTPLGGGGAASALRPLRHIAALPLSASQRVAIVEIGSGNARRWLVLGVTAQSINTLHTMAPQDPPPAAPAKGTEQGNTFAQLLTRLKRDA